LFDEGVSYAFESPYQTYPLDLLTESFYYDRRLVVDARIQDIAAGQHMTLVQRHESKFRDTCCIGVRWEYESHVLLTVAAALGPKALSAICLLFAQNYKQYCGGLPDLCLWRYHEDGKPECLFVEVKGPNDRLSTQQMEWIDFLSPLVNVELCKVVELIIE
jgi:fanconi-associated nuclease 1